ncbi:phenylacetate-CoA oxygenase/reductase subunit PaaK [Dactylosporangium aurantiacum]|uniref:3-ketosteroid-9-alpha-monooxygenase, ferredoxin reductase component n=1 Tax=Dactylosporangium aurantiacum TaxID=35754 RepID=A0A9Q9IHK7_9ACTN|nr:1,2-phenylacetyl-CoA epoxidase subunit PaaE [Dactylosporangium aurantiacum]MDG6101073.1 phenylacetate-CoA oxygenase/reductase subunit PaaK [Dactylosporangium aurantiacum]UWZ54888.1 phenylacetate-CoA oxygenase/reductase subunit PaaK [Dactylosporangium aurantiacum]
MTTPLKLRRPTFQRLAVMDVEPLTDDSVVVTFDVPAPQRAAFAFQAGQHLTVRRFDGDTEIRRSYSICSTPAQLAREGLLRVGIRAVPGGAFSSFAVAGLCPGDEIDVMPPLGHFTSAFDPSRTRHYAALVAGSGITPVLSIIATALDVEPSSRCTVVYGNRAAGTVMFAEELADLKDRHRERLHVIHVLSREAQESALLSGRLDEQRIGAVLDTLLPAGTVDEWFLCGPHGMVLDARVALSVRGVPDDAVHTELFHVADVPVPAAPRTDDAAGVTVDIVLDGRTSRISMAADERILDAALRQRPELPYACKGGVCSTCRAKVVEGEVSMARNFALEPDELAAGYVLTCQALPITDKVVVDYDA